MPLQSWMAILLSASNATFWKIVPSLSTLATAKPSAHFSTAWTEASWPSRRRSRFVKSQEEDPWKLIHSLSRWHVSNLDVTNPRKKKVWRNKIENYNIIFNPSDRNDITNKILFLWKPDDDFSVAESMCFMTRRDVIECHKNPQNVYQFCRNSFAMSSSTLGSTRQHRLHASHTSL